MTCSGGGIVLNNKNENCNLSKRKTIHLVIAKMCSIWILSCFFLAFQKFMERISCSQFLGRWIFSALISTAGTKLPKETPCKGLPDPPTVTCFLYILTCICLYVFLLNTQMFSKDIFRSQVKIFKRVKSAKRYKQKTAWAPKVARFQHNLLHRKSSLVSFFVGQEGMPRPPPSPADVLLTHNMHKRTKHHLSIF